jgi:acetyl-CoA acetyltransferase
LTGVISMSEPVWILGTSMTPFGRFPEQDTTDLGATAAIAALSDADVSIRDVEMLAAGCLYGTTGMGQRIQQQIGQTGIPVYNVANACATGATAVRVALMSIASGESSIAMAVGVEQLGKRGVLPVTPVPRGPNGEYVASGRYGGLLESEGLLGTGMMAGVFSIAGMEYAAAHGVTAEQFAKVAEKNHRHSALNPLAQYRSVHTLDEIMNAPMIAYPNTVLMCCPTGDGAAAIVLVSGAKLRTLSREQQRRAVKVSASILTSDPWTESDQVLPDINTLTRNAADQAYEAAGIGPSDLDLVELHDCFATAELLHYENLRLCDEGEAGRFIDSGAPWRDGRLPVNVSGGLISKGHPFGATGIANLYEVVTHLRDEAGERQIDGAQVGLTHVIGIGSACSIHILEKAAI